jgi:hypothetical protein
MRSSSAVRTSSSSPRVPAPAASGSSSVPAITPRRAAHAPRLARAGVARRVRGRPCAPVRPGGCATAPTPHLDRAPPAPRPWPAIAKSGAPSCTRPKRATSTPRPSAPSKRTASLTAASGRSSASDTSTSRSDCGVSSGPREPAIYEAWCSSGSPYSCSPLARDIDVPERTLRAVPRGTVRFTGR